MEVDNNDKGFTNQKSLELLKENYDKIKEILDNYMDMEEDDKILITIWIIGTYFHKEFISFPYLFVNAMRSSGKTRLENIIKHLAWNGEMLASLREATIFRVAGRKTLIIDEFENIGNKETLNLQELLNASYKKGMKVFRMKKVRKLEGEEQVIEEFEPYCPIVMANINGMGDTLLSRCISIILERSNNPIHSLKIEDFDSNIVFLDIKDRFRNILVYLCSFFRCRSIYAAWNFWIDEKYTTPIYTTTYNTYTTQTTSKTTSEEVFKTPPYYEDLVSKIKLEAFFLKIHDAGIMGRDFELFMSLFMVSYVLGEDILDKMIEIAKKKTNAKKIDEAIENNDVLLIEFVAIQDSSYIQINELTEHFKLFIGEKGYEKTDINRYWLGRALKRLNLVLEKRRMGAGIEVRLNIIKAKEKAEKFR